MDTDKHFSGTFSYSSKSIWVHLRDVFVPPWQLFIETVIIVGAIWTLGEPVLEFTDIIPKEWDSLMILSGLSVCLALARIIYKYINRTPLGFENESPKVQRIAHLQRKKWEFILMRQLLHEKIIPLEKDLEDLVTGRRFVISEKITSLDDYKHWLLSRSKNVNQMIGVAQQLLLVDFPVAMQSSDEKDSSPTEILQSATTLKNFYRDTIRFEESARAVYPSEQYIELHSLQYGWSNPIREAIGQLFELLDRVIESNPKDENKISFVIDFGSLPNIDKFLVESDKVQNNFNEEDWS